MRCLAEPLLRLNIYVLFPRLQSGDFGDAGRHGLDLWQDLVGVHFKKIHAVLTNLKLYAFAGEFFDREGIGIAVFIGRAFHE